MYIGGDKKKKKSAKTFSFLILAIVSGGALGYFFINLNKSGSTDVETSVRSIVLNEDILDPRTWGKKYPLQFDSYMSQENVFIPTPYGGSLPYSRNIRYPINSLLWAGHPYSIDRNEERSHIYSAKDLIESKRVDANFLQNKGLESFKKQPGSCLHCHSSYAPQILKEMGEEKFAEMSSVEHMDVLSRSKSNHLFGAHLGSACNDCHKPDDLSLRITRSHFIKAMVERGYKKDENSGIKATHNEMRSFVCMQCHSEYYLEPKSKKLQLPWKNWRKNTAFEIEMLHDFYQEQLSTDGGFRRDYTHAQTGAPMLKVQHPASELYSSSLHAKRGVSCSDCHMPYSTQAKTKYTNHSLKSPLLNLGSSCLTCHSGSEDEMREIILNTQKKTSRTLKLAQNALHALIVDIEKSIPVIEKKAESDLMNVKKLVNRTLANARMYHRHATLRWDYIRSENSTGFHSPEESQRVLASAIHYARRGQLLLHESLSKLGVKFSLTSRDPRAPRAPRVIKDREPPVGSVPPNSVKRYDAED